METDHRYICYIVENDRDNFINNDERSKYLIDLFSNPEILHIDLSEFNTKCDDIFDICEGLKKRSDLIVANPDIRPIKYIDMRYSSLIPTDILTLCKFIHKYKVKVDDLVLVVNMRLTDENFYDEFNDRACTAVAQGMRVY